MIIIDENGNVRGIGYHECDIITPKPGWVEQDPNTWWDACQKAAKLAVQNSGCGKNVTGIGFSGQMQGCTLMDKNMDPIGNCIIWLDQRSSEEVTEIERITDERDTLKITTNYCLNSFWAPKLFWVKKHRPKDFEKVYKVLFAKDYLRYMMTGEIAADVSDASLSFLMDVPNRRWSDEMFGRLGLPKDIAPGKLAESAEVVGQLKAGVADDWGLTPGIPVVTGGGDQPAGGVGIGDSCGRGSCGGFIGAR